MKKGLWNSVKNGCVLFALITVITYTVGYIISTTDKAYIPSLKSIYLYLIFSVIFGIASELLRYNKLKIGVRILLHYVITAILCFLVIVAGGGMAESGFVTLITMFVFTIIYAAAALIIYAIYSAKNKTKNNEEEYKSMFR